MDCRIRGGEYTEPDQANYATSLKVWLPRAKDGDAEAQYYVGQIFEKGLGTTPDYESAAEWYGKAAEQEFSAAQISLGFLSSFLAQVFVAPVADRGHARTLVIAGVALNAVGLVMMVLLLMRWREKYLSLYPKP